MTIEERAERARMFHKSGCNCCQAVVMAYSDLLPIGEEDAKNVAAPFGRGLAGMKEVCGCVSGMAMVCGLTGRNAEVRNASERYREEEGDVVCGRLLQAGKKPCGELVVDAVKILYPILEGNQ